MTEQHTDRVVERFHATNGRVSGYVGLACTALILAFAIAARDTGRPLGVAILALLGALLVWAVMLRPSLWATDRDLVMRGIYHTDTIPLAAIDRVAVGQVTSVTVGERRFVTPVVGYTARQTIKQRGAARKPDGKAAGPADTYQVFVEERISHLAREAAERAPGTGSTPAAPRRTYAWPEIVGTGVLVVAFLVWLLVL
ncbi:MAG TPA: hypothetical protein VFT70_13635 [Nocardioides sp.]|nr:hypothetical protein [Nocardioides sp.]